MSTSYLAFKTISAESRVLRLLVRVEIRVGAICSPADCFGVSKKRGIEIVDVPKTFVVRAC